MIWSAKHRENSRLLRNYLAFLDECPDDDSRLKLCEEITRLHQQNKAIDKMTFEEVKRDCNDYKIEVTANLNLKLNLNLKPLKC